MHVGCKLREGEAAGEGGRIVVRVVVVVGEEERWEEGVEGGLAGAPDLSSLLSPPRLTAELGRNTPVVLRHTTHTMYF